MFWSSWGYLVGGFQPAVVGDVLPQRVLPVQRLLVDAVVTVLLHLGETQGLFVALILFSTENIFI